MRLSCIFPVFNQHSLATTAIDLAIANLSGEQEVELVILDNGSDTPFPWSVPVETIRSGITVKILRSAKNIGVYPTFWWGLKESTGDVLAFFHSDLMVAEKGWDKRVLEAFSDQNLGLVGFIGSNEIDSSGGRGRGTTSNFQGGEYKNGDGMGKIAMWKGSPAEAHGKRSPAYSRAAVVDGCAMILRRSVLEAIKQRENFPPHHFYDRLLSCEVRELGYEVAVLGIACDHISGQTVNQEQGYDDMAREWATEHKLAKNHLHNWDSVLYQRAESLWLTEYRDTKRLVPCRV
jgi:cellulose synthase/poly-beta-1,6-N-acetylglucosamine synthase-like glycosyltransferase